MQTNDINLRKRIAEHIELIKYDSKSMREASARATSFLVMVAILADEQRSCEEDKAKLSTMTSASFSQAMAKSVSKQVTEKKLEAESDEAYTAIRESFEECEAKIRWLKTYIEIFNNAHITYRQFSKE